MGEEVRYNRELDLIEVRSHGETTEGDMTRTLREIARISALEGTAVVLVDAADLHTMPSLGYLHQFVLSLLDLDVVRDVKIAILAGTEVLTQLTFMETVAKNRGAPIRVFRQRQDALVWLFP